MVSLKKKLGKRPFWKINYNQKDNTKMDVKEIRCGLDSLGSE
jgi:hypothetical protein